MKKILSAVLSLILLLTMAVPVCAEGAENAEDTCVYTVENMHEYACTVADSYLKIYGMIGCFEITQGISIINASDQNDHIYFVFQDGINVAYLNVSYVQDAFSSSFVAVNVPGMDEIYGNNVPFLIYSHSNSCYLYSEGKFEKISGFTSQPIEDLQINSDDYTYGLELTQFEVYGDRARGSSAEIILPNFPVVANANHYDAVNENGVSIGTGVCWAACAAAVGKFETGISVRAIDLYNWAKNNISYSGSYPLGTAEQTLSTLNTRYGLSYVLHNGGATAESVWNEMLNGTPIIAGIRYYDSEGERQAHMVVICGAIMSGTDYYYVLMDPNVYNSYVTVYVGPSGSTNFTYASNSGTYTTWERRIFR